MSTRHAKKRWGKRPDGFVRDLRDPLHCESASSFEFPLNQPQEGHPQNQMGRDAFGVCLDGRCQTLHSLEDLSSFMRSRSLSAYEVAGYFDGFSMPPLALFCGPEKEGKGPFPVVGEFKSSPFRLIQSESCFAEDK